MYDPLHPYIYWVHAVHNLPQSLRTLGNAFSFFRDACKEEYVDKYPWMTWEMSV